MSSCVCDAIIGVDDDVEVRCRCVETADGPRCPACLDGRHLAADGERVGPSYTERRSEPGRRKAKVKS